MARPLRVVYPGAFYKDFETLDRDKDGTLDLQELHFMATK
jgi:Ca2+-binding EF-hand superfamily protein